LSRYEKAAQALGLMAQCMAFKACGAANWALWPNPVRYEDIKGSARAMALACPPFNPL
jgi:hypothetical protein